MAEETNSLNAGLDELLKGKKTEEIVGPNGVLEQLRKALLGRLCDETKRSRITRKNVAHG